MKDYLPIPANICRRPKVVRMMMREHCQGFGALIQILLYLRECDNYRCHNDVDEIAMAAMIVDTSLVKRLIENYDLFVVEENKYIVSTWLREQMEAYDSVREKRAAAGRASAAARASRSTSVEQNSTNVQQANEQSSTYNTTNIINTTNTIGTTVPAPEAVKFRGLWSGSESDLEKLLREKGDGPSAEMVDWIAGKYGENHVAMRVIRMAQRWKLSDNQVRFLYTISKQFMSGDPIMQKIVGIANSTLKDNFIPKFPLNFIISKLQ